MFSCCWRKGCDTWGHFGNCVWLQLVWWTMKYVLKEQHRLLCGERQLAGNKLRRNNGTVNNKSKAKRLLLIAGYILILKTQNISWGGGCCYLRVIAHHMKNLNRPTVWAVIRFRHKYFYLHDKVALNQIFWMLTVTNHYYNNLTLCFALSCIHAFNCIFVISCAFSVIPI